jgi:ABC-type branched-subunit amino acid transport system ATPase component
LNAQDPDPRSVSPDPRSVYGERLTALETERTRLRQQDRLFGFSKLGFAVVAVVIALWLARAHPGLLAWAIVPAVVFAVLWIVHERLLRRMNQSSRLKSFYQRGLARLDDQWAGKGDTGERFLDPNHLYSRDLDVFGQGSLYELISQAASAPGQHTLAEWLLHPVAADEIIQRQKAVRELASRLDLREQLALAADAIHEGTPEALLRWAESRENTVPRWLLYAALPLAVLWLASMFYWFATSSFVWFALLSFVNLALTTRFIAAVKRAAADVLGISSLLGPLHRVLAVYEAQPFESPRLQAISTAVRSEGLAPSRAIARLERNLEWLESSDNWFVKLINRFVFWTPLCMLAIEAWRRRHGSRMRAWLTSIGDFEALSSLAGFAYERSDCSFPTLENGGPSLQATALTHPLLPRATAIPNDVSLHAAQALIIVSGPNMAGKSTLLRAIGLNVVLAQCGAPVCCTSFTLAPLAVGASITVQDSLQSGLSRFYAEIQRLKRITDLANGARPALFLLDELLSGTNSHDRRVGTEALLRSLLARNAIGLITTHDLALTEIADALNGRAINMHFGDRFSAGELHFDYKLTPGIADSTNALQLMRSIGLEV